MIKKTIISLLFSTLIFAQSSIVRTENSVYNFIESVNSKTNFHISLQSLPLTRKSIYNFLAKADSNSSGLTSVEKEQLNFYLDEFGSINNKKSSNNIPWRLLNYKENDFELYINPLLNLGIENKDNNYIYYRRWGLNIFGGYGNIGFNFLFTDSWIKGDNIDIYQKFSPNPGYETIKLYKDHVEFSEIEGSITYSIKNFIINLGKERMNIGSGERGKLILSNKAPSFPSISFSWQPVKWLKFNYFHGWLNSRVTDSAKSYNSGRLNPDSTYLQRVVSIPKFIALHSLQLSLIKNLDILLGESIIYSDEGPKLGFLIPILFFRAVDHYYEGGNYYARSQAGGNTQFFLDVNYRGLKNVSLYSTVFADEFSITNLFNGNDSRNQLGYTVGMREYDNIISNLNFGLEYTKILPWVYSNLFSTQTFTNSDYLLGHYIGQNADRILAYLTYSPMRALQFDLTLEKIRQGGFGDVSNQYSAPGEKFLYGPLRKELNYIFRIKYEPFHFFNIMFKLQYSNISDQNTQRTPSYLLGENLNYSLFLRYGF